MNQVMDESLEKTVLVMDDDEDVADSIKDAFKMFADGKNGFKNVPKHTPRYKVEIESAPTQRAINEHLKNYLKYDAFIIDKRFVDKDHSTNILAALRDLQVDAPRIVYTAHGDPLDLKRCMRLGAWDYVDKGQEADSTIRSVVEATVLGLHEQLKSMARHRLDVEAHRYVREHTPEIIGRYAGRFLALQQVLPEANKWECIADDDTLFGLYAELSANNVDRDTVHVTHIDETMEDENDSVVQ